MIIRSKAISVLLGPAGMGIADLLNTSIGMVSKITNFGLGTSAVKNISESYGTNDKQRFLRTAAVFRKLVWITGALGMIGVILLAPVLSKLAFGDGSYTVAFLIISVTLLINQLGSGNSAVLQGTRQITMLAKASFVGSVLGVIFTIPLYYFYGLKGIVPGIVVGALISYFIKYYFYRKLKIKKVPVTVSQTVTEGREMVKMGFMISMSGLIALGSAYILRLFISREGSLDDVGLYNAGFAIANSYVGLVFTAMAADYYPRLAAVASNNSKAKSIINEQAEVAVLLMGPIIMFFLTFVNVAVILLYSTQFLPANDMILYALMGILFKAASWSIAYVFLAKSASRVFFWNELISNLYTLGLNLLGYKLAGLTGLGLSFLIAYFIYLVQVYIVTGKLYKFSFHYSFIKILIIQYLFLTAGLITAKLIPYPWNYVVGVILVILCSIYSYIELDKRVEIRELIKNRLRKR